MLQCSRLGGMRGRSTLAYSMCSQPRARAPCCLHVRWFVGFNIPCVYSKQQCSGRRTTFKHSWGAPELVAPHPSNTGVFDACSTLSPRVRRGCWTARGACPPRRPRLRGWLPTKPWAPDHRPPRRQRRQQPQLLYMCRTPGAACPMERRRCRRQSTGSLALAQGVPLSR